MSDTQILVELKLNQISSPLRKGAPLEYNPVTNPYFPFLKPRDFISLSVIFLVS